MNTEIDFLLNETATSDFWIAAFRVGAGIAAAACVAGVAWALSRKSENSSRTVACASLALFVAGVTALCLFLGGAFREYLGLFEGMNLDWRSSLPVPLSWLAVKGSLTSPVCLVLTALAAVLAWFIVRQGGRAAVYATAAGNGIMAVALSTACVLTASLHQSLLALYRAVQ